MAKTTVVLGERVHVCPCCGSRPNPRAVSAGVVYANCENADCLVDSYELWGQSQ